MASFRLALDTGGTFTDVVAFDEQTGAVHTTKTPTTPADPSLGFMVGGDSGVYLRWQCASCTVKIGGAGLRKVDFPDTDALPLLEDRRRGQPWPGRGQFRSGTRP